MTSSLLVLDAHKQSWPLDKPFRIARGSNTETNVVVVTVTDGQHTGRGEAVPITRYGQSVDSVLAQIESMKSEKSLDRQEIQKAVAGRRGTQCVGLRVVGS